MDGRKKKIKVHVIQCCNVSTLDINGKNVRIEMVVTCVER